MLYGICTPVHNAGAARQTGWDFIEENAQKFLVGDVPSTEWQGLEHVRHAALPVLAANSLIPASLKITGPEVDIAHLMRYMHQVCARAKQIGITTLVFGSGGARNVPEGFDHVTARQQIVDFLAQSAPIAAQHDVTLVVEHLNTSESNIITSLREALWYVQAVGHPNVQCLVDSYHFWLEDEPLENLRDALPAIRHVHLADKDGCLPPGESGSADYRPLFRALKDGGYTGPISVEARGFEDIHAMGARVLDYIKQQWAEA
ncbi:MAG: sugar phosphate isomerase/epimerase [Chloroflexota bacterium]|nr:sugar phosphate isomerase/epimerase [Chloroflexota bacterium]